MKEKLLRMIFSLGLVIFILTSSISLADDLDFVRVSNEAKKQVKVAEYMNLTGEKNEIFWDIYADYQQEVSAIQRDYFELLREYSDAYRTDSVTNEMAGDLMQRYFDLEEQKLVVKRKYVEAFKEALTRKQIARFFQIDHKTDAIIEYEMAQKIPLIK